MNIDEAIKILEEKQKENEPHWERGDRDACQLGIEALKREIYNRQHQPFPMFGLLPSETKE